MGFYNTEVHTKEYYTRTEMDDYLLLKLDKSDFENLARMLLNNTNNSSNGNNRSKKDGGVKMTATALKRSAHNANSYNTNGLGKVSNEILNINAAPNESYTHSFALSSSTNSIPVGMINNHFDVNASYSNSIDNVGSIITPGNSITMNENYNSFMNHDS